MTTQTGTQVPEHLYELTQAPTAYEMDIKFAREFAQFTGQSEPEVLSAVHARMEEKAKYLQSFSQALRGACWEMIWQHANRA